MFGLKKKENNKMTRDPAKEAKDRYARSEAQAQPLTFPEPPQEQPQQVPQGQPVSFDQLLTKDDVIFQQQAMLLRGIMEIKQELDAIKWALGKFGVKWETYNPKE